MLNQNGNVSSIQELGERFALAVDLQLTRRDRLFDRDLLQLDAIQRGLRQRQFCISVGKRLFEVIEHAILHDERVRLIEVGELDVERELLAGRLLAVESDGEIVERHFRRHRLDRVGAGGVDAAGTGHAVSQLVSALQIDRAPWSGRG